MATPISHKQKIRNVLRGSVIPMDVENVRSKAGLRNWESTKSILLEMVLQGKISGQRTTKGWIFWINLPAALAQQIKHPRLA